MAAESSPGSERGRSGDIEREVVDLYQAHARGLLRYGAGLVHNAETAQDALQEVFLRYFIARSEGMEVENSVAWLYRVLRNHLIDHLRAASQKLQTTLDQAEDRPDESADPERRYSGTETMRQVMDLLSQRELECLRLRAEGLSYSEMAEVMGLRVGTVGALLARAQKKFRELRSRESGARKGTGSESPGGAA